MPNFSRLCHVLLLAAISVDAQAKTDGPIAGYVHTGWTQADGAPAEVRSIVQDDDGWLWLACPSGLYRFDGDRFERISEIAGHKLHQTDIVALSWIDHALWVGYQFGGIERFVFRDGTSTYFDKSSGLSMATVYQFAPGPGGMVSAGTMRGLYEWRGHGWTKAWPAPGEQGEPAWRLLRNTDGSLLMQVGESRILRRAAGATTFTPVNSGNEPTIGLIPARDGGFWAAGVHHGFLEYDAGSGRLRGGKPTHLTDDANDLIFARDGSVWMVLGQSIQLLADTTSFRMVDELTRARGLSDGTVLTHFEDREGNLWLGTNGGVDRIRRGKVHPFPIPNDVHDPGIAPAGDGSIWISSRNGTPLRQYGRDGNVLHATSLTWAENIHRAADGSIWAANNKRVEHFVHGKEEGWALPHAQQVQTSALDRDGSLWTAILGYKGLFRLRSGTWDQPTARDGFPDLPILLAVDARNRLWQGYQNNVVGVTDGATSTLYTDKEGLRTGNVLSFAIRNEHVWVGGEQALMFLRNGHFVTLNGVDGSDFLGVSGMVETGTGDLWMNGLQGITHIAAADLRQALAGTTARVPFERFDYQDGVVGQSPHIRPLPSLVEGPDGRIWYATNSAVGWIDPAHVTRNPLPPPVRLRTLVADGRTYGVTPAVLQLPASNHNLRIDYTALSLTMPERLHFRYRLGSADAGWVDAGARRTAFYTALKPGTYHFQVQAANEDGVWNRVGAAQDFTVAPTLTETTWFRALCVLALAGLLWLGFRWRLAWLAAQMRLRMNERIEERARIARELHDTLLQSVQGLVLKVHGASLRLPSHEPVRSILGDALTQAENIIIEGRRRVFDLRTREDGNNLVQLVTAYSDLLAQDSTTCFTVTVEGKPRTLKEGVETEVLAICREAMGNASRHARATTVSVTLHFRIQALTVKIEDDGIGIANNILASAGRAGHFGLTGMRERAARLGAVFTVGPPIGGGTACVLTLRACLAYRRKPMRWWPWR